MTRKQGANPEVHGIHAVKRNKTKCGLLVNRLPDGNNKIVNTNAIGQITCKDCLKANKPGKV